MVHLAGNTTFDVTGSRVEQWRAYDDVVIYTPMVGTEPGCAGACVDGRLPLTYAIGEETPPADTDPPNTGASLTTGRYLAKQTVSLVTEQGATTKYCLTPGCTPTLTYSAPVPVLKNIAYQVLRYSSTDAASNVETVKESVFRKQRRK